MLRSMQLNYSQFSMPVMKELGAQWLVEMATHIADNPQFIVNGLIQFGITDTLDGKEDEHCDSGSEGGDSDMYLDEDEWDNAVEEDEEGFLTNHFVTTGNTRDAGRQVPN